LIVLPDYSSDKRHLHGQLDVGVIIDYYLLALLLT
jgi:hypothetical protein